MKKRICIALAALLLLSLLLCALQMLVIPKYTDNREGALIREYYREDATHDVIFIGDCEIYESLVPAVLWEEYGIRSYLRGSPQQLTWHSYYLLEETLRRETPKAVVFNVLALKYDQPQNEAYNRMTLDGMKWSASKVNAIRASMTDEEHFIEYLFPLLRYHSRITDLTADDLRYLIKETPTVSHNGYLMQTDVLPQTDFSAGSRLPDYRFGENAMSYLDRMHALCQENGVELILMKAPTNFWMYWWHDEWESQVTAYADEHALAYYNFIPRCEEIGIDWSTDTYDGGAHLNVYGAEKLTRYFGKILQESHDLADCRDQADAPLWQAKVETFYQDKKTVKNKAKRRQHHEKAVPSDSRLDIDPLFPPYFLQQSGG